MPAQRKPLAELVDRRPSRAVALEVVKPAVPRPVPDPPAGLLPSTVRQWDDFWRSDVAAAADPLSDMPALVRWITLVDEWHICTAAFRRVRVVPGSMGQPVLSPLAGYIRQLESSIGSLEDAFGMKPSARARLRLIFRQETLTAESVNLIAERAARLRADREDHDADLEDLAAEFEPVP